MVEEKEVQCFQCWEIGHKNWREMEAKSGRAERVKCSACGGKDAVVGEAEEKNKKGEIFCLPCKTGRKMPWQNQKGGLE